MKFSAITVVSLSLGYQALAAPIDVTSTVASLGSQVESVPSEALGVLESLPVVGALPSALPDTGLPIVRKDAQLDIGSTVSGVGAQVESVPSDALAVAESLPLVGDLTSATQDTGLPLAKKDNAQDIGSPFSIVGGQLESIPSDALAGVESSPVVSSLTSAIPATSLSVKRDISISTITGLLSALQASVSSELSTISESRLACNQ